MLKTIKNLITSAPKKVIASVLVLAIVAAPLTVFAGWGPERPVFDHNKFDPSDTTCRAPSNDHGRCGSMTGPVFNSFINTPSYGDERNFVRIAPVQKGANGEEVNPNTLNYAETSQADTSQQYWVRTLVHNNANSTLNCLQAELDAQGKCTVINPNAVGVAKNTRVRVEIAQGISTGVDVMSNVSADNVVSPPGKVVFDTATLANANKPFSVSYVPGSAKLYNPAHQGGIALGDDIVSATGAQVGYDQMNGNVPGCFEFSAYVYVKVEVKTPGLTITKNVSAKGSDIVQDQIATKVGETVRWTIDFKNNGTAPVKDLTVRDTLPAGVTLVPGSIRVTDKYSKDKVNGDVQKDTALNAGGVNLGEYLPGESGKVTFETKINADFQGCELQNVAFVRGGGVPETSDTSKVTIENCVKPPVTPPVTPPAVPAGTTPTILPDTGAGGLAAIFLGTSTLGTALYRIVLSRRFNS